MEAPRPKPWGASLGAGWEELFSADSGPPPKGNAIDAAAIRKMHLKTASNTIALAITQSPLELCANRLMARPILPDALPPWKVIKPKQ